jgi:hypothetical protein
MAKFTHEPLNMIMSVKTDTCTDTDEDADIDKTWTNFVILK